MIDHALREIYRVYGDECSIATNAKSELKFGRNKSVGTGGATVMELAGTETDETFVSANDITHIASSSGSDTGQMVIDGFTIADSNLTFVSQSVTLNGQTEVALDTPLHRVVRGYNNAASDLVGKVSVAEDVTFTAGVPSPDTAVHLIVDGTAGSNQSQKCSTSISQNEYWIVTSVYADVLEKTAAFVDVELQVREIGKVFRNRLTISASSDGGRGVHNFNPYAIVPKNADVRLRAVSSGANIDVSGGIQGYVAKIDSSQSLV